MSLNDLKKKQLGGQYRDIEVLPGQGSIDEVRKEIDYVDGVEPSNYDYDCTVLEVHANLDLEGYEDVDEEGEPTGIKVPYIVTISEDNGQILSIRRNYAEDDELKKKTKEVSLKVDGILIKKLLNSKKNNYDTYSEFWKTYVKVKKENKNLTDLSRSLNKNKNIANLLIRKLYELKSETAQGKFIEQAKIDFPYLDGQTYNNSPTIKNIVQLADNFTGTLKLKNQGYLINHLKNSYEGDVYKNLKGFTYKNQNYNQTYKKGNVEKITKKNGQLTQLIVLEGSKKIIDAKFK
jgi:hypothetical protein